LWRSYWVGPGRGRKSTRPDASGDVELSPFDYLDRLADLVPPPRKHRHRYHGVFSPNHKLRSAATALTIGNIGKRRDAATDGHAVGGHAVGGDATALVSRPRATRRLGRARSGPVSTGQSSRRRIDELPVIDIDSL